jgi:hypothetical protein
VEPAVARAPVAEVLAAARSGTVSPWRKYHEGNWNEPGLNGNATTPVIPDGVLYSTHGDAAYSTYLGKYILSGHTGHLGKGVYITFSDDATSYDVPSWIQSSHASSKDSLSPFETIVNVDGTDNGVVGRSFYVYYGYRFKWANAPHSQYPALWRWLYRQKVTLNRAGFDSNVHEASTGFTNRQGENNWRYIEYDGARYTAMTWDGGQFRWNGSERYLIVGPATQHPDGAKDSVRVWVAPKSGRVRIGAPNGISAAAGPGADGVGVKILHNGGTQIWPAAGYQAVAPGTTIPFDGIDLTVAKGDALYFHVNQNGSAAYDTVTWTPVISYVGPGGITS